MDLIILFINEYFEIIVVAELTWLVFVSFFCSSSSSAIEGNFDLVIHNQNQMVALIRKEIKSNSPIEQEKQKRYKHLEKHFPGISKYKDEDDY